MLDTSNVRTDLLFAGLLYASLRSGLTPREVKRKWHINFPCLYCIFFLLSFSRDRCRFCSGGLSHRGQAMGSEGK
jgi:hypothetical protein